MEADMDVVKSRPISDKKIEPKVAKPIKKQVRATKLVKSSGLTDLPETFT